MADKEVGRISIKVTPNLHGFYKTVKEEIEKVEAAISAKIKVQPDMGNFRQTVAARTKGMRAKVAVDADVDKGFFGRITQSLSKIKGPSFGSGINPAGYAAILAGVTVLAAPLLGLVTTALLTLPGLISMVATPIAALALGMDGLKKAAEVLKKPFQDLKTTMSGAVQNQFTPVFESIKGFLPTLQKSLPAVTQGLADMAQGAVDAVIRNTPKIESTIQRIGAALSQAKPGVDGFVSGFIGLADELSKKFPAITQWFNEAGTKFDAWITKMTANGDLSKAFSGLGDTLKIIFDLIGDLGKAGMDWIKKPENIEDFNSGLKDIANALRDIANFSAQIKDAFKGLFPSLNWDGIKKDLTDPFTSKDAPWRKFGNGAEEYKRRVTEAQTTLDETLNGADAGQRARMPKAITDITDSLATIPPAAVAPQKALDDILAATDAGQRARSGAPAAPEVKAPPVPPPDMEPAKQEIAEYQSFVDTVTAQVRGALQQATSGETLPAPNFDAFKAAWAELPGFVADKIGQIRTTAQSIGTAIGGALASVTAAAAPVWDGLMIQAVTAFNGIVTAAEALPGKIGGALGSLSGIGATAGASLMSGLLAGMQGSEGMVLGYAGTLAGRIAAVKGPLPKDRKELIPAGEALMQGLGTGLENGLDPVLGQAKTIAKQIFEAFHETFGSAPGSIAFNLGGVQDQLSGLTTASQDFTKSLSAPTAGLANGSSLVSPEAQTELNDLKSQLSDLELQRKRLAVAKDQAGTKDEKAQIQDEIDKLNAQKRLLDLRKEELKQTQGVTGQLQEQQTLGQKIGDMIANTWQQGVDGIANFGRANLDQGMSDLGMGGGALTAAMDQGLDWAQKLAGNVFNIQVGSVDDAIAVKNNQLNKQALQYNRA